MVAHLADSRSYWLQGMAVRLFKELPDWAARPDQTPERVRRALERLKAIDTGILHVQERADIEYILTRRIIEGDEQLLVGLYGASSAQLMLWARLMPWERDRALRMLNLVAEAAATRLKLVKSALHSGQSVMEFLPERYNAGNDLFTFSSQGETWGEKVRLVAQFKTTPLARSIGIDVNWFSEELAAFDAARRGTMLTLAIEAYRLEKGHVPPALEDLVGEYFDALPHDPYSGLDYVYFPAGPPPPVDPQEAAKWLSIRENWPLADGQPSLWCTSRQLVAKKLPDEPEDSRSQASGLSATPEAQRVYYVEMNRYSNEPLSLFRYRAWALGMWFPVPAAGE